MVGHDIHVSRGLLHEQVTHDLLARISAGALPPGTMIPTEEALCREYGVSRITIRRAIAVLVQRGLIARRRGIGSFVTGRPADKREFHLVGFLDDKLDFDHRLVFDEAVPADAVTAACLGVEPGTPVRHICSVVHRDDQPFTLTHAYTADLPGRRVSPVDYAARIPSAQAMGKRLGRQIVRAEQELDAVPADALAAQHLEVPRRTPLMRARRTYFSAGEAPIQHLIVLYRPDCYRFVVDLVPRSGTTAFQALPATKKIEQEEPA